MAGEQHRRADRVDGRRDVGVILGDVLAEIRVLARPQRTAVLAQVEREKSEAFRGEALGHVALEEIVGIAVEEKRRRSEEHTSELQSRLHLVCRLLLEKKKKERKNHRRKRTNYMTKVGRRTAT